MKVTERKIWITLIAVWFLGVGVFFFLQRREREASIKSIKYVSLPEEISQAKTGDSLTAKINDDTLIIQFYRRRNNQNNEYLILKD